MDKRLGIVVFFAGAIGMILELVGSRVLAPYFGNSLYVWTGLIGVVLGSMSLGYFLGGKLADRHSELETLSKILIGASLFVFLSALFKEPLLQKVVFVLRQDQNLASLVGTFLLFGPASVALGCIAPYAAKMKLSKGGGAGSIVGGLYALSTLGSIAGTFAAGYFLIPSFGNTNLMYFLSLSLLVLSCISSIKTYKYQSVAGGMMTVLYLASLNMGLFSLDVLADVDSIYNRIIVRNVFRNGKATTILTTSNFGAQSSVYPSSPDILVSEYTNAYRIGNLINPNLNRALMLGGAGFTFPRYFVERRLGKVIDVVEIDPGMVDIARKYFFYKDMDNLNIHLMDARIFMRDSKEKYDVIYLDAFNSINPPYHLTTVEFVKDIYDHLTENGFLMVNVISSLTGPKSMLLGAEGRTIRALFDKVDLFVIQPAQSDRIQNLMLVAYKGDRKEELTTNDSMLARFIASRQRIEDKLISGPILTDDYAPVEYIAQNLYN